MTTTENFETQNVERLGSLNPVKNSQPLLPKSKQTDQRSMKTTVFSPIGANVAFSLFVQSL